MDLDQRGTRLAAASGELQTLASPEPSRDHTARGVDLFIVDRDADGTRRHGADLACRIGEVNGDSALCEQITNTVCVVKIFRFVNHLHWMNFRRYSRRLAADRMCANQDLAAALAAGALRARFGTFGGGITGASEVTVRWRMTNATLKARFPEAKRIETVPS